MKKLKRIVTILLAILSAYMLLSGLVVFTQTSGVVQGSEFGMQITISHQLSLLMMWIALFTVWRITPAE